MSMNGCGAIRPLLSAYLDNDITPEEARLVQAHVATCAECATTLAAYREIRASLRNLPTPAPPPTLRGSVFRRATSAQRRQSALVEFGYRSLTAGAVLAAVVAIAFTLSLLFQRGALHAPIAGSLAREAPTIVSWDPPGGTLDWNFQRPMVITFSKPMDRASVTAALRISGDPPLEPATRQFLLETLRWEDTRLIIGAAGGLEPDTDYTIAIDAARALDTNGQPLRAPHTSASFRTTGVVAIATTPSPAPVPTRVAPTSTYNAAAPSPTAVTNPEGSPTPSPTPPTLSGGSTGPMPSPGVPVTATPVPARTAPPSPSPVNPPPPPAPIEPPAPTATPAPPPTPTPLPPTATPAPSAQPAIAVGPSFIAVYAAPGVSERVGAPVGDETKGQGAVLQFEHGMMIWRAETRTIFVLFAENPAVWYAFADGWDDSMPPGGGPGPAAGQFEPKRGFGKVWREQSEVRKRLGYARSADEQSVTLAVQSFSRGMMLAGDFGGPGVIICYQNNIYERR